MVKIENSFNRIKKYLENELDNNLKNEKEIDTEMFFNLLKNHGEVMKDEEIQEILKVLKGDVLVPESLTFQYLFEDILKFEAVDSKEENTAN